MNNFCEYCGLCCKIIPEKDGVVIRDGVCADTSFFVPLTREEALSVSEKFVLDLEKVFGRIKFCKCKYITNDNVCKNLQKPDKCKNFPLTELAIVPEECCYIGEVFLRREELKSKVRKYKEEIIHYESLINSGDRDKNSYKKIINNLQKFIDKYALYGSADW